MRFVKYQDIGRINYNKAWGYQKVLFNKLINAKKATASKSIEVEKQHLNYLIFCEHPHVITLGKSGAVKNILADKKTIEDKGVDFVQSNRGGDVTYHGPGQIVGYPIFDLDCFFTDIHRYMRYLEEVIIKTIAEFGVIGERIPGQTGVWVGLNSNPRKICAFGVRSSRWVTMHGFALNVNTDLSFYDLIIPCGISDKTVTSLESEIKTPVDINEVKEKIKFCFAKVFKFQYID